VTGFIVLSSWSLSRDLVYGKTLVVKVVNQILDLIEQLAFFLDSNRHYIVNLI